MERELFPHSTDDTERSLHHDQAKMAMRACASMKQLDQVGHIGLGPKRRSCRCAHENAGHRLQAVLAMKRLGPSTCLPLIVPAPADPAPCPVFAALSYL